MMELNNKNGFMGYIDNNKKNQSRPQRVFDIDTVKDREYSYILIMSPKFYKDIYRTLIKKNIPKNKVRFCCSISNKIVKNPYIYILLEKYERKFKKDIKIPNKRYHYFPTAKHYTETLRKSFSEISYFAPFRIERYPPNIKSKYINTDKHGFRKTKFKNTYISAEDIDKYDYINILLGNSTALGSCVADDDTIASNLSMLTNEPWINLSVGAAVSLTEYIHLIRFAYRAKKIKNIVFFSGANDIIANLLMGKQDEYDNFWRKYKNIGIDYDSSDQEKYELTIENFKRNFILYSSLKKQFKCNIIFILQPYIDWMEKKLSPIEKDIFSSLDEATIKLQHAVFPSKDNTANMYKKVVPYLQDIAREHNIVFINSANYFTSEETLFSDKIHLTELGCKVASNLIYDAIYNNNIK